MLEPNERSCSTDFGAAVAQGGEHDGGTQASDEGDENRQDGGGCGREDARGAGDDPSDRGQARGGRRRGGGRWWWLKDKRCHEVTSV